MSKIILCALSLCLLGGATRAHVTASPDQAPPDSYVRVHFVVAHGCDGSPTVAIRIRLPAEVLFAKPQAKPGWQIEIRKAPLAAPVSAGHGRATGERVVEIEWRGGKLDDAFYDEFALSLRTPEGGDRTLWFPVTQICEKGSLEWVQIPAQTQKWGDVPHPAPYIRLLPGPAKD